MKYFIFNNNNSLDRILFTLMFIDDYLDIYHTKYEIMNKKLR